MRSKPVAGKLMAHAICGALSALVFGLSLGRILIEHRDTVYFGIAGLCGAAVVLSFIRTRHVVEQLAATENVRKSARQFVWSCVFFAMISGTFGLEVSGIRWLSSDFLRKFGLIFWGVMTLVAIFPVSRDARRLASAARRETASD